MEFSDSAFWVALLQIIWIDILLSGDNAVVIALACRSLPDHQKKMGIVLGAGAAIGLRVIFATFIVYLMAIPFLKIAGGLLLLWIAVKLILPEEENHEGLATGSTLFAAVKTIVIADVVMSLDNVIAIAAASHGSVVLLILGLLISIPLILFGSALILRMIERFPIIVTFGAALLGYIAGEVMVTDPTVHHWVEANAAWLHTAAPIIGAVLVVAIGHLLARRAAGRGEETLTEEVREIT
ncbi:TerC family protein [Azospirillum sp. ST 5-10]|uniref:TerC family protein n=1 Tax=unclassified Azospirillum TaxID=2630922 RepID=UPI003F4A82FC